MDKRTPGSNHSSFKLFLLISIIMIFIAIGWNFLLSAASHENKLIYIMGENGVWDLSGIPAEGDYYYHLRGPVEFIPDALLTPAEFAARETEALIGYPHETSQYATSRMRIIMPDDRYYTFNRRSIDYSHRLYVNGIPAAEIGNPGTTRETNTPGTGKIYLTLKAQDGVIELVQQASIFVHRDGGSHSQWRIGTRSVAATLANDFFESISLGAFLALFLIFILLFLFMHEYKGNLYFALFCIIWFLRSGFTGSKIFAQIFPRIPWEVMFRIEYLSIPATGILLASLLDIMFPNILQKWFLNALYAASGIFACLFLFTNTLFMSNALLACQAIYLAGIIFITARFAVKMRKPLIEHNIFLAGVFIFFLAAVYDMVFYNNFIRRISSLVIVKDMTPVAMLLFTFCQAIALFIVTMRKMKVTAEENVLLAKNARMNEQQLAIYRMHYEDIIETEESGDKTGRKLCDNKAVNAVILHYLEIAQKEGIRAETQMEIPENTGDIPEMDICIIIGGLFENAIKACRRINPEKKHIKASSHIKGKTIKIEVINNYDEKFNRRKEDAVNSEGMWLSSVRAICIKHKGKLEKKAAGGNCRITAQIPMESAAEARQTADSLNGNLLGHGLSKRENEVARLMVEGLNAEEIGERLFISEGTVRLHMNKIYQKFDVAGRSEFMTLFIKGAIYDTENNQDR